MPSLVDLQYCECHVESLAFIRHIPMLRTLDVSRNKIAHNNEFAYLFFLPRLDSFKAHNNEILGTMIQFDAEVKEANI